MASRIIIHWETQEPTDLIFAERAIRYMTNENPSAPTAWLLYGEPPVIRVPIRRTPKGFVLSIQTIEPSHTPRGET